VGILHLSRAGRGSRRANSSRAPGVPNSRINSSCVNTSRPRLLELCQSSSVVFVDSTAQTGPCPVSRSCRAILNLGQHRNGCTTRSVGPCGIPLILATHDHHDQIRTAALLLPLPVGAFRSVRRVRRHRRTGDPPSSGPPGAIATRRGARAGRAATTGTATNTSRHPRIRQRATNSRLYRQAAASMATPPNPPQLRLTAPIRSGTVY
jgi:hypothetical protein